MTRESMIELRIPRDLALWLGCIEPESVFQHRLMRASGQFMLVRDTVSLVPLFWPIIPSTIGST